MKITKLSLLILTVLNLGSHAQAMTENPFAKSLQRAASEGGVHGGGGDVVTEKKIKDIRDNLLDFISRGGDRSFKFYEKLDVSDYENGNEALGIYGMKQVLTQGAVTVNVIKTSDEDLSDELKNTRVNGARKICKGIFSAQKDRLPYLICDIDAFNTMDADPVKNKDLQTVQIAHEYHSLAGIEKNIESDSDYWLSGQLRAHMGFEKVRQLVLDAPQSAGLTPGFHIYEGSLTVNSSSSGTTITSPVKIMLTVAKKGESRPPLSVDFETGSWAVSLDSIHYDSKTGSFEGTITSTTSSGTLHSHLQCIHDTLDSFDCALRTIKGVFKFIVEPVAEPNP